MEQKLLLITPKWIQKYFDNVFLVLLFYKSNLKPVFHTETNPTSMVFPILNSSLTAHASPSETNSNLGSSSFIARLCFGRIQKINFRFMSLLLSQCCDNVGSRRCKKLCGSIAIQNTAGEINFYTLLN